MKNTIKILAAILATLMLVSFVPLAAFADEIETGAEDTETTQDTSTEQTEPESEQEETSQYDNDGFSLPEDSENVHYERLPNGLIKVTVYPNVTESEENGDDSLSLPGHISVGGSLDGSSPMAFGPGADHTILDGGASGTYPSDTYIASSNPTTNYGNATEALVTNNKILYISYPLPYIPGYATLVEAKINIAYVYDDPTQSVEVYVHKVNISWTETGLTWNVANQNTRLGLEQRSVSSTTISDPQGTSVTTPQFAQFDILDAAQEWLSGESENNGVALKTYGQLIKFKTSEASYTYRPSFEYIYSIPAPIENGTYRVHNIKNGQYLDIENGSTNEKAAIELNSFTNENRQKWVFTYGSDGYYTIKSLHSNKYIGVDITDGISVKQYSYATSDYTKWAVIETTPGVYILKCKEYEDEDLVLSSMISNESLVGENLLLLTSSMHYNEWGLGISVEFNDLTLDIGDTATANIQANCPTGYVDVTDYTYTVTQDNEYISINNSTGTFNAISAGTATITAIHKQYNIHYSFDIKVNKNAIIIVPGMPGSELFVGEENPYFEKGTPIFDTIMYYNIEKIIGAENIEELWREGSSFLSGKVSDLNDLIDCYSYSDHLYESLSCNEDGTSKYDVYVKKYKPPVESENSDGGCVYGCEGECDCETIYTPYCGILNVYKVLYDALAGDSRITSKYSVEFFSYDWRLSNGYSAQKLDEFIDESGYDKVILVAHSMGGLVASGYLALGEEQRNKTIDVYALASPLLGMPETINIWANCDLPFPQIDSWIPPVANVVISVLAWENNAIPQLISNYPSVYELLPTEKYLDAAPIPYLINEIIFTELPVAPQINICDYDEAMEILEDNLPFFDMELMSSAEAFHNSCYISDTHVTRLVDTYYIYAIPEEPSYTTLTTMSFFEEHGAISGLCTESFVKKTLDNNGDTLVPYWSSTLGITTDETNVFEIVGDHMSPKSSSRSINHIKDNILLN